MIAIADQKANLRKEAYGARAAAHAVGQDDRACANLRQVLRDMPDMSVIAAYMPIRTEISPMPVMAALVAQGRKVCVPVIQGAGQALRFREWTPAIKMVDGPFGAKVPDSGEWLVPQLLITPLVAFDRRGYRLGYGGGFYDRSFEQLRATRKTLGIGFAYAGQQIAMVPTEPTDQRLDAMVTELEILTF